MKLLFVGLVLLHGIIHLIGFIKGFGFREVSALKHTVSKQMAFLWLIATVLFMIYAFQYFFNLPFSWVTGFAAVLISQILIIFYWQDVRFGTIPNLLIVTVSFSAFGFYSFQQDTRLEVTELFNQNNLQDKKILTENEILHLPEPVKRWLHHSGAVGNTIIQNARIRQLAELKMKPEQEKWLKAEATQYSVMNEPGFVWSVDVQLNSLLGFQGRDRFINGKGEMLIQFNSLFEVVNEEGEKISEGAAQRFLGELVWFPSLAISPFITWQTINDTTAMAVIHYKGVKGMGTFYFNSSGDFIRFSAWRYKDNTPDARKFEWVLTVTGYKVFDSIRIPAVMAATWRLDQGDWTWLKLEITDLKYNSDTFK